MLPLSGADHHLARGKVALACGFEHEEMRVSEAGEHEAGHGE
jgi:hypothetical protein